MQKITVYLLKINHYRYIGQTKNFNSRKQDHAKRLKKNTHENSYLQQIYNQEQNLEFIKLWTGLKVFADIVEQSYINKIDTQYKLNLAAVSKRVLSLTHKKSISQALKKSSLAQASQKRAVQARVKKFKEISKNGYYNNKFVFEKEGEVLVGTANQLKDLMGVTKSAINNVLREPNKYKSVKGWKFLASSRL